MPEAEDLVLLAKFPFLPGARQHVASSELTLADLLEDPAFDRSRKRALARVRESLVRGHVPEVPLDGSAAAEVELLSYPVARAIVAQVSDDFLVNRYAVAEAKLLNKRLVNEPSENVRSVSAELGLRLVAADGRSFARLHFLEFLRHAPARDPEWKLVNQRLASGYVVLTRMKTIRLAEEALRARLGEELGDLDRPGGLVTRTFGPSLAELQMKLAEHRARFKQEISGEVRPEAFPPCMDQIWKGIQGHVNIPHMGRFAIVSFLNKLGMDSEAILKFFSSVPDFDVNKSRYQIEHITGKIGGGTAYTPPTCQTMQTYGICPLEARDALCFQITHPLTYYRRRTRELGRAANGTKTPPPAAKEVPPGAGKQ